MSKLTTWTPEATEALVSAYELAIQENGGEAVDLEPIAKEFGRTVPAIRSKLVNLKVYVRQEKRAVGGASATRKIQLVREIEKKLGVSVESFEKATKADLETLLAALGK